MLSGTAGFDASSKLHDVVEVVRIFADRARVAFDAILARRMLSETLRAIPGEGSEAWLRRLNEVGESINLRIDSLRTSVNKVMSLVDEGVPVAYCEELEDGTVHWHVLSEARGSKVLLRSSGSAGEVWVPWKTLPKRLGLESLESAADWVIGRAALSAGAGTAPGEHEEPTPFSRLVALMRPEARDLWVVVVFSAVVGILSLATPIAVEALVNTVAFGRYLQPVIILALLLFTSLAFAAALRGLIAYVVEIVQRRLFVRVVEDLAYRLPRVTADSLEGKYGPELVNRFFDVVTVQKVVSTLLVDGVSIVIQTVIGMCVLAFYHPFLLGYDIVLVVLFLVATFGLGRGAVYTAVKESKAKYAIAYWLEEITRLPSAFKLHGGSRFALERADQLAIEWLNARRSHFRIVLRQVLFTFGLQAVASTVLLGLGGWLVISGELTLGQLVAAELIVMMVVGSFTKLGKHLESFYDLLASMDKLGALFDLPVEPHDNMYHLALGKPAGLSLSGVETSPHAEPLSMELEPGESVAIVGPVASGKSRLIDVLIGLRYPLAGHIELDGVDYRELRRDALREQMGVCREVEIFRGTIDENVHLNRPQLSAWDVRSALDRVGLLDELLRLPEGLNTELQPGGGLLSESQAVQLMLARAIVAKPRVLLVDGLLDRLPTSRAEKLVHGLAAMSSPWTMVLVTNSERLAAQCQRTLTLGSASNGPDISNESLFEQEDGNGFGR